MIARPTARSLLVFRNQKWTAHEALAELIDNSFGELRGKASIVWMAWSQRKRMLTVLDNGQGMNDVIDLFTVGQGTISGPGDIGLYGYGGSAALLWLADVADVYTLRDGRVAHGSADWKQCIELQQFPDIDKTWRKASITNCPTELLEQHHGTLIRLHAKKDLRIFPDVIQERLSRIFSVGLRNQRHIQWDNLDPPSIGSALHPWSPGTIENPITATITLDNGLSATVHAGPVPGLAIDKSKLSVNFLYRQIKETTQGFGRPVQGAFGYVDLSPQWLSYLTPTKDDINEDGREYEDQLMGRIAELLADLIDQLQRAKRAKIFNNVKVNLKVKFERGFIAKTPSGGGHGNGPGPSQHKGPEPSPHREKNETKAAEIEIEEATEQETGGLLCTVLLHTNDGKAAAKAFVNKEHKTVVAALDSEPVNQMLLEQLLVEALGKELVKQDALVAFGLLSQRQLDDLLQKYDNEPLDLLQWIIRLLTDGIESEVAA
jgi:hypothetical protein